MTEQEQVEEIEEVICNMKEWAAHYYDEYGYEHEAFANCIGIAEAIYNAGYRKVPDGAVVLLIGKNNQALDEKTIVYFVKHNEQIRKETAREILNEILFVESVEGWEENEQLVKFSNKIVDKIEELANKYGVEAHDDGTRTN